MYRVSQKKGDLVEMAITPLKSLRISEMEKVGLQDRLKKIILKLATRSINETNSMHKSLTLFRVGLTTSG